MTSEENDALTRVGSGTRMGNLMRRYWHPVAAKAELEENPVKLFQLLGESLVLYRDKRGRLGLLTEACPHRGASLAYGIIENEGLRCPYHGWLYNSEGHCIQQPLEPWEGCFDEPVRTTSYPVRELGGLIFAYLGPEPAPLLPRYDAMLWDDAMRETDGTVIDSNWLQVMENLLDPYHVESLHGRYFEYILRRKGGGQLEEFLGHFAPKPMKKIAFDRFENGIVERHMYHDAEERCWKEGAPTYFPTTTLIGSPKNSKVVYFVVPLNDTHTWLVIYLAERTGGSIPWQETPRFINVPGIDKAGKFILDTANGQDHMAVVSQGETTQRSNERLCVSDIGITLYRELLMEQIERVERGEDPINVCEDRDSDSFQLARCRLEDLRDIA
jgi:5,5'-dehydrodivanillate O-demethylase